MGAKLGICDAELGNVELTKRGRLAGTGSLTLHASMNQKRGKTLQKPEA
jgi:hypothetical protein